MQPHVSWSCLSKGKPLTLRKVMYSRHTPIRFDWRPRIWRYESEVGAKQSRTTQVRGAQMTCQRAEDQQLYNRTSLTSWAHRASLSSEESLCCPACPPPPHPFFFFADSRAPVSKVACLNSLYLFSTCMYHTFSHITFLGYNHVNFRASFFSTHCSPNTSSMSHVHMSLGEAPSRLPHGFSSRGVAAVRARRLFPSTISGVRGSALPSRLTSAGFEPCPQGPAT